MSTENNNFENLRAAWESDIRADERHKVAEEHHQRLVSIAAGLASLQAEIERLNTLMGGVSVEQLKRIRKPTEASEEEVDRVRAYLSGYGLSKTPKEINDLLRIGPRKIFAACRQLVASEEVEDCGRAGFRWKAPQGSPAVADTDFKEVE